MRSGSVFQIERFAVHDGPGSRVAVLLKGSGAAGFHTAIETSGYAPWSAMAIGLRADLVFFDTSRPPTTKRTIG